jgi:ferric-dicitrate binding protein FerR (iron transport regulator)
VHQAEETTITEILSSSLDHLRSVNPDTARQWLRLERAITQREVKAIPRRSYWAPRLAFGVAVLAIVTMGIYLVLTLLQQPPETFVTKRGEQKDIMLEDGTHITLSYASELTVPKEQAEQPRQVMLTGEAYFRVRHRDASPFIIRTSYADVEVVGTEFNVRARESTVEVGVIEGSVNVRMLGSGRESSVLLMQRQMVVVRQDGIAGRVEEIGSPHYPGWMHGKLLLDKASFRDAIREIEMRFGISIAIDERHLRQEIITGILDARTAQSALTALCELTGRRFTHDGEKFRVY